MILVTEKRLLRRGYTFAQVLIEIVYYSSQKIMIKYSSSSRKSSTDIPIKNITNLLNQPLNYLSPRHLPIAPSFKPIQAQKHYRNSNIQIPRAPKTARARNENYQQLTQTGFKSINCTPQKSKEKKNNSFTGVILQKKDKSDYQNESKENLNLNSNLVMNNSHRALQQLTNSTILRQNPKEDKKKLLRETLSSNGLWNPHKNCLPPKPYQVSPFASMHSDNKKRSGQLQRKDKYPSEIDQIEKIQFKTHSRKNSRTQQQRLFFRQSPLHQSKVTQNKYTNKNSPAKVEVARSRSKRQRTTSQVILPIAGKYSSSLNSSRRASLNNSQLKIQDFDLGPCKGEGRFGKFYPALHKKTGYLMGIKQVKKEDVRIMLDQFILEIKICMYLNHPNIVKVYAFFSDKTYFYILMEYMEEGTLYKAIKSSKKLSEENACVKLYQICDAVSYLHSNDILHRDIKPQNIVMSNGVCKLCDFGWATSSKERRKTYCGTLDYVCPQILEGQSYDNFVDIWAIGVLAYEMLTGKAPFYHISRKQTMKSIMNCDFSLPLQLSIEAKMFIRKALQKNPDQRITIEYLTHDKFVMQGCHKL